MFSHSLADTLLPKKEIEPNWVEERIICNGTNTKGKIEQWRN